MEEHARQNCYRAAMSPIPNDTIIKWRALSLKRLGYMVELQRTGRWRLHYPSQEAFEQGLRVAEADAERWKRLAYGESRPFVDAAE